MIFSYYVFDLPTLATVIRVSASIRFFRNKFIKSALIIKPLFSTSHKSKKAIRINKNLG